MRIVKVSLIVLLPIGLFGAGCPSLPLSPLVGIWQDNSNPGFPRQATFNADGTATLLRFPGINGLSMRLYNYSTMGSQLTVIHSEIGTRLVTFSISGDTLTVIGGGDTATYLKQ